MFKTDKQTLADLNITGRFNRSSLFVLFNRTVTKGGERELERMFEEPMTLAGAINQRSEIFSYLSGKKCRFPFSADHVRVTEDYVSAATVKNPVIAFMENGKRRLLGLIARDKSYESLKSGFNNTLLLLEEVREFTGRFDDDMPDQLAADIQNLSDLSCRGELKKLKSGSGYSFLTFCRYDHHIRYKMAEEMSGLLKLLYRLDVYISVANYSSVRGFVRATAVSNSAGNFTVDIKGVYHPALENAVPNDIKLGDNENILFLTGANMAGKSTFMKSFSISVYLAHMGFPVPARSMLFSAADGIYTSINVPDNLKMGYSHFYAEVIRVKKIASEVAMGNRLLVIFDEMFKGTNVKDAFDATVCITECFGRKRKSVFIISTHIMEAAIELQKRCGGIEYKYLPATIEDGVPRYPYILTDGVSDDRYGMTIVNNERILDIIKNSPAYEID